MEKNGDKESGIKEERKRKKKEEAISLYVKILYSVISVIDFFQMPVKAKKVGFR